MNLSIARRAIFLTITLSTLAIRVCSTEIRKDGASPLSPTQQAEQTIPPRDESYTFSDVWGFLHPHLKPKLTELYTRALQLMFNVHPTQQGQPYRYFPEPKHPNATIIKGWRCLLRKLLESEQETENFAVALQHQALMSLPALHKKPLETADPELFALVQDYAPCPACVKSSREQFIEETPKS